MRAGRGYDIFPRTVKARALLALAFGCGLAIIAGAVSALLLAGDIVPEARCSGPGIDECLEAQTELRPISSDDCEGFQRRVCLVPLGRISPELVQDLIDHYEIEYDLTVTVLTPSAIPPDAVNRDRGQVEASSLTEYMGSLFPHAYYDPNAVLIGLTPADLYTSSERNWRYAFGVKGTFANPKAVISTSRMDPRSYSFYSDNELLETRTRRLVTKYIGFLYYGLAPSDDPRSALYDNILSPADLDGMGDLLPVSTNP